MILGVVRATVVATVQHPFYAGKKLLLVDKCDASFKPAGGHVIAIDTVDAGIGDRVIVLDEGNGARQVLADDTAPVRSVIVGVIDEVTV